MNIRVICLPLLIFIYGASASAKEQCHPSYYGMMCEARVGIAQLVDHQAYAIQQQPEWCWVASVHMLFKYYGYDIPQAELVRSIYGSVVNLPAFSGETITRLLSREWKAPDHRSFRVDAHVFDVQDATFQINNNDIIDSLAHDHPLIVGAMGHAMLLIGIQYVKNAFGGPPTVFGATVFDPWPGRGMRQLGPQELRPQYVAEVSLSAVGSGAAAGTGCTSNSECKRGRVCLEGKCTAPSGGCAKDVDCPGDQVCVSAQCVEP